MIGTILLILVSMSVGMVLCFMEESGHRTPVSKLIDKIEKHMEGR